MVRGGKRGERWGREEGATVLFGRSLYVRYLTSFFFFMDVQLLGRVTCTD